jgi:hypothetical protein
LIAFIALPPPGFQPSNDVIDAAGPNDDLQPDSSPAPLSAADWELFMSLVKNPPRLPDKLLEELARQRRAIRGDRPPGDRD